jgi:hypothetical protein
MYKKSQVHDVCDMVVVDLQMSIFIDFFIINEKIEKNIKKADASISHFKWTHISNIYAKFHKFNLNGNNFKLSCRTIPATVTSALILPVFRWLP